MPWFWTDDLADLLEEHDGVDPGRLADLRRRPFAIAASDEVDPLHLARDLAGLAPEREEVA